MSTRIRVAEIDPKDFEHGLRCAQCSKLLIQEWGKALEDGRPVYERRIQAAHVEDGEVVWTWELTCEACA